MKTLSRRVLAIVGSIVLIAGFTSCSAPLPNGSGSCNFTVDYPHGSERLSGYIDGKGKVKCTFTRGKLTNLKIETRLQKWNGSSWVTVAHTTRTTTQASVKSKVTYTGVSQFIPCQKGIFRTQTRGYGYLDGVKSQSIDWQTTDPKKGAKDPCVKPLKVVSVG